MSYSTDHLHTAGKITVLTALIGLAVFTAAFIFNLGVSEVAQVDAQSNATTSVTVLNVPPYWVASTTEETESSQTNPTNEGDEVAWVAVGADFNSEDYYLLICSTSASPTPGVSGAQPSCSEGIQWAVSTSTISGTQARAATTTTASTSPFAGEIFNWYAWICDDNDSAVDSARCSLTYTQGTNATNSSPFEVNHRPNFVDFWDDSPAIPGLTVTFTSTSSDDDISGGQDTVRLFVCATAGFDTLNDTCSGTTLASSTVLVTNNATATYTIVIPTQDQDYAAYGYVVDEHGLEASGGSHGSDSVLTVDNVAPTVSSSTISLNGGLDMILTNEATQTPGFTLQFTVTDNNSCENSAAGSEITGYALSIYRAPTDNSSSTCTPNGPFYDPNDCYPSSPTATSTGWNLSCTASSTSCTGATDVDQVWDCTFPLWYVADPTDGTSTSTEYFNDFWYAQVQAADDGFDSLGPAATGTLVESASGVKLTSFLAFALNTLQIPYGSLEPGQQTDPLNATTTISATGNVGLDKDVTGTSMCTTYTNSTPCPVSATSTIPEYEQVFATSTVSYNTASSSGNQLSSTTPKEIEINVPKTRSTTTPETADAYWGIRVPSQISFSGDYYGENTFIAKVGESIDW